MFDLAIKSNRVVTPPGVQKAIVLIKEGRILDIVNDVSASDHQIIDAGNDVLMPGVIDPHVHINEPGRTEWEGFETATKAAIAGGVTTLVDMPLNSSPVTTTAKAFDEKLNAAKGKLNTNVGFWGGVIPGNEKDIEPLIEKGVLGFKAFLTHSGIDEFPNVAEADLRKVLPIISHHGLPLLVHCEISNSPPHASRLTPHDQTSYQHYLQSRPKSWEDNAISLMIRLCEEFNCKTHIVHLSSADSIPQIITAKEKGLPLTVETSQHYLYFSAEQIPDSQPQYKCAPPIREKENNERLWQALKDGIIDFVATDHSPAPPDLKLMDTGDLMKAWGGIASIQFALPVLWTAAKKHNCEIPDIVKWLCYNSSILPGLEKTKGKIAKGYDADLVIWSPEENFTVETDIILHKHKLTPYLGENLIGVVQQTFLAGEKVFNISGEQMLNRGEALFSSKTK